MSATWSRGEKCHDCDQHGHSLKPTHTVLMCPWKIHFTFPCLNSSKFDSYLYKTKKPNEKFQPDSKLSDKFLP